MNFTGSALAVLTHALEVNSIDCLGGRIMILTCSRPNAGLGALSDWEASSPREGSSTAKYAQLESERILYTSLFKLMEGKIPFSKTQIDDSAYSFYSKIIATCKQSNISIDICITTPWIMGRNFLGLATLGDICQRTCGTLKWLRCSDAGDIQLQLQEALL